MINGTKQVKRNEEGLVKLMIGLSDNFGRIVLEGIRDKGRMRAHVSVSLYKTASSQLFKHGGVDKKEE